MKLVALMKTPADPQAAVAALTEAAGLTVAEARMRTAPEPPALLARLEPGAADALAGKLRAAGLAALAVDERAPLEGERTLARTVVVGPSSVTLQPRAGAPLEIAWPEVSCILRGASKVRAESARTEKKKSLAVGAAIATGGMILTKTTQRTVRSTSEETEHAIFLYGAGGQCGVLREQALDFSCLGKAMQPSRTANMTMLARQLKEKAPGAFYDERLVRLGRRPLPFVVGAGGELQYHGAQVSTSRVDTASGLELLAEVMYQALRAQLLP